MRARGRKERKRADFGKAALKAALAEVRAEAGQGLAMLSSKGKLRR